MKKLILLILLNTLIFAKTINIAVAANVSYAIDDLIKEFNKHYPSIKVKVTLGSSGKLTAQITHGAPYNLFISANMKYPNSLYKNKIAITKPVVYAQGSLAFLSTKEQDFSQGIEILKNKNISKIAIANPKTAPYGVVSVEALKNAKIYNKIKSKFVYGESISQTVIYATRATDIGIIAKSSLFSSKMKKYKENINWKTLDKNLYTPISQGVVLIKDTKAQEFYDFILSNDAKKIFKTYGYIID